MLSKQHAMFYQILQQCENINQENYSMWISIHLAAPIQSHCELYNLRNCISLQLCLARQAVVNISCELMCQHYLKRYK